ncbi:reverse transcriptase domain-containing protein [Tanacetum coccineum]
MALLDNRIESRKDCILGIARGNLAYSRFMFTVYPQYGISLDTKDLDQTLAFVHEFERSDLMKPGNKVFSITYLVAYALTSSHHSIDYKKKEYIEIDDLFNEIGSVEGSKFATIKPIDETWAIDIAKNKKLIGQKPPTQVKRNKLHIGETPHIGEASSSNIRLIFKVLLGGGEKSKDHEVRRFEAGAFIGCESLRWRLLKGGLGFVEREDQMKKKYPHLLLTLHLRLKLRLKL